MTTPRYQWQPTTSEIAAMAGIEPDQVIRFDHNTSPFATPWALDALSGAAASLNEYPEANYHTLRTAAAAMTGLAPGQIVPGAGVDELILLCARAFLSTGSQAVQVTPTYPLYRIATAQVGAALDAVASTPPSFAFPTDPVLEAVRHADLVWLCVPNNPTGTTATEEDIAAVVAASHGLVVIDAAYAEFSEIDWTGAVDRYPNVIVLRTLSKAFGIAGARVGFAMAHESLIDAFEAVRPPGSVSSLSVSVAVEALRNPDRVAANVAATVSARSDLAAKLAALGWIPLESHTNFVLCDVGPHAAALSNELMNRGLVVRTFPYEPLTTYIRVTVRTPHQHDRLIEEIRSIQS